MIFKKVFVKVTFPKYIESNIGVSWFDENGEFHRDHNLPVLKSMYGTLYWMDDGGIIKIVEPEDPEYSNWVDKI